MPPKNLKKRKRCEHPKIEAWTKIASTTTQIAKFTQQVVQYTALLKQIIDVTRHDKECPENTWELQILSETLEKDIYDYIQKWLEDLLQLSKDIIQTRDDALKKLRTIDVLDDQALKNAALVLAETEFQCGTIETTVHKWNKIVRHSDKSSIIDHTQTWIRRWLKQWKQTNTQLERAQHMFICQVNNPFIQEVFVNKKD
jgi:hypothetical protein